MVPARLAGMPARYLASNSPLIMCVNLVSAISPGATQLTGINADEGDNIEPHWSPDGSKLAFNSSRISGQNWDVYVMNADGSGVVEVSNNLSTDSNTNVDRPRG